MKAIKVTIGGKTYPLKVEEADEQMMIEISRMVDDRLKNFRSALSFQPEATSLVMTCLSIAEELYMEQREKKSVVNGGGNEAFSKAVRGDLEKIINSIR